VRDAVTDSRLLAGDLADAGHTNNLEIQWLTVEQAILPAPRAGLYTSPAARSQPAPGILPQSRPCSEKE
jgi:hypothetical protein